MTPLYQRQIPDGFWENSTSLVSGFWYNNRAGWHQKCQKWTNWDQGFSEHQKLSQSRKYRPSYNIWKTIAKSEIFKRFGYKIHDFKDLLFKSIDIKSWLQGAECRKIQNPTVLWNFFHRLEIRARTCGFIFGDFSEDDMVRNQDFSRFEVFLVFGATLYTKNH